MEETYIKQIMEETGQTREYIIRNAQEKQDVLGGLISKEGALILIMKELKIEPKPKEVKKIMNEQKKEEEKRPWWQEAKEAPIAGGVFLPVAYGFQYVMHFDDIESPRQDKEVNKKDMQGNPTVKYWYYIILTGVGAKKTTLDVLIEQGLLTQAKVDRIKALEKNKEYLLELPKTARTDFGEFITDLKLQNGEPFSMVRTGKGGQTKYVFKKLESDD